MATTLTGPIHAAEGHAETVLIGAIGCNNPWGIVDALISVTTGLVTRGRARRAIRRLRRSEPEEAAAILEDAPPEDVGRAMAPPTSRSSGARVEADHVQGAVPGLAVDIPWKSLGLCTALRRGAAGLRHPRQGQLLLSNELTGLVLHPTRENEQTTVRLGPILGVPVTTTLYASAR